MKHQGDLAGFKGNVGGDKGHPRGRSQPVTCAEQDSFERQCRLDTGVSEGGHFRTWVLREGPWEADASTRAGRGDTLSTRCPTRHPQPPGRSSILQE